MLNGLALGTVLAGVVWLWFDDLALSGVIFAALLFNLMAASLAGVAVPLTLRRLGFDPALASSIFLTTVTDVLGFLAFLGLGTLLLL
jgi:magnesium transporter